MQISSTFRCNGLDNVACSLCDAVLLAEADEVHFWGGGGGFKGHVNIFRSH